MYAVVCTIHPVTKLLTYLGTYLNGQPVTDNVIGMSLLMDFNEVRCFYGRRETGIKWVLTQFISYRIWQRAPYM